MLKIELQKKSLQHITVTYLVTQTIALILHQIPSYQMYCSIYSQSDLFILDSIDQIIYYT